MGPQVWWRYSPRLGAFVRFLRSVDSNLVPGHVRCSVSPVSEPRKFAVPKLLGSSFEGGKAV